MSSLATAIYRARVGHPVRMIEKPEVKAPTPTIVNKPVFRVESRPLPLKETCAVLLDYLSEGMLLAPPYAPKQEPFEDGPLTMRRIRSAVIDFYNLNEPLITGRQKARFVTRPRQIGMYLCATLTGRSLKQVGEVFGGRDHSTVLHAKVAIGSQIETDEKLASDIQGIMKRLGQG